MLPSWAMPDNPTPPPPPPPPLYTPMISTAPPKTYAEMELQKLQRQVLKKAKEIRRQKAKELKKERHAKKRLMAELAAAAVAKPAQFNEETGVWEGEPTPFEVQAKTFVNYVSKKEKQLQTRRQQLLKNPLVSPQQQLSINQLSDWIEELNMKTDHSIQCVLYGLVQMRNAELLRGYLESLDTKSKRASYWINRPIPARDRFLMNFAATLGATDMIQVLRGFKGRISFDCFVQAVHTRQYSTDHALKLLALLEPNNQYTATSLLQPYTKSAIIASTCPVTKPVTAKKKILKKKIGTKKKVLKKNTEAVVSTTPIQTFPTSASAVLQAASCLTSSFASTDSSCSSFYSTSSHFPPPALRSVTVLATPQQPGFVSARSHLPYSFVNPDIPTVPPRTSTLQSPPNLDEKVPLEFVKEADGKTFLPFLVPQFPALHSWVLNKFGDVDIFHWGSRIENDNDLRSVWRSVDPRSAPQFIVRARCDEWRTETEFEQQQRSLEQTYRPSATWPGLVGTQDSAWNEHPSRAGAKRERGQSELDLSERNGFSVKRELTTEQIRPPKRFVKQEPPTR